MSSRSADSVSALQFQRSPQMRDYEGLHPVFHPYLGFTSPRNFRSPSVSTDAGGYRVSEFREKVVTAERARAAGAYGVALGGSFTFGVGATQDRHSIVSRLGEESGKPYLNRAVRAGNSVQELLAALPVLDGADDVVICTGINNLSLAFWSSRTYDDLGPFFYDEAIALLSGRPLDDLAATIGRTSVMGTLKGGWAAARDRQRPSTPPRPVLDPDAITTAAADRHLRDLRLVVAAAHRATRLIFVMQPFLDPNARELHPQERGLAGPEDGRSQDWWTATIEFIRVQWPSYTEYLERGCRDLGVHFGVLASPEFEGWAFVDRAHMTDNGQQQAACRILEMMSDGPS